MKKTLFLLALCALAASCNSGGKISKLQKENDSLRAVLSNGNRIKPNVGNNISMYDTALVDSSTTSAAILSWEKNIPKSYNSTVAFVIMRPMIDSAFAYTDSIGRTTSNPHNPACGLILYPGVDTSGTFSLYWQPIYTNDPDSTDYKYVVQYVNLGGKSRLFDHTMPCPVCGVKGEPTGQSIFHK
jgi:hypothetical protein